MFCQIVKNSCAIGLIIVFQGGFCEAWASENLEENPPKSHGLVHTPNNHISLSQVAEQEYADELFQSGYFYLFGIEEFKQSECKV